MTNQYDPTQFGRDASIMEGFLWVGCSDLPVMPFEMRSDGSQLVHLNLGNLALPSDMSFLASLKLAIETCRVSEIIVCGHYGCSASAAAAYGIRKEILGDWLFPMRRLALKQSALPAHNGSSLSIGDALAELNVAEQMMNVSRMNLVRDAWETGQQITIRGMIFDPVTQRLSNIGDSISPP